MNTDKQQRTKEGKFDNEAGSVRDIYSWLNKNGEIMSIGYEPVIKNFSKGKRQK